MLGGPTVTDYVVTLRDQRVWSTENRLHFIPRHLGEPYLCRALLQHNSLEITSLCRQPPCLTTPTTEPRPVLEEWV